MMRWDGFTRSLLFGALAGAFYPAFALVVNPRLGAADALALYLMGVAVLYLAGLSADRRRALGAAALAAAAGALLWLAAPGPAGVAVGAALAIGVGRSGVLYAARPARAFLTETALLLGGLVLARRLAGPDVFSIGLAVWGFFLVQSVFFWIGGVARRAPEPGDLDPFDLALRRAEGILEDGPAER